MHDETPRLTTYGPFHRVRSPTQSDEAAGMQAASQEMWGRARRGGAIPQVQAYSGPLTGGSEGVEFKTRVRPDRGSPPGQARWTGPREGVVVRDDFARIAVKITKNTQSVISPVVLNEGEAGPSEGPVLSKNGVTRAPVKIRMDTRSPSQTADVENEDEASVAA